MPRYPLGKAQLDWLLQIAFSQESLGQPGDALRTQECSCCRRIIKGPEPARGSLDEVICYTAGEISSRLEQTDKVHSGFRC